MLDVELSDWPKWSTLNVNLSSFAQIPKSMRFEVELLSRRCLTLLVEYRTDVDPSSLY